MNEKRVRLELLGITYNQIESGVYALILQQAGGTIRLPIIIGFPEAQAIECKLQEVATPRPLTHDTMVNALSAFGIRLLEVEIYKLPNGVFAANLLMTDGQHIKVVDSRSSDAVSLAIRVGAPIFTSESVLRESGFKPEKTSNEDVSSIESAEQEFIVAPSSYSGMSLLQLSEAMLNASEREDYEEAARIKAEIEKRNSKSDTDEK